MNSGTVIDLEPLLDGARFWGAQLDARYRVLALTVEPQPANLDGFDLPAHHDRLQVLCHPVALILGSLTRTDVSPPQLLTFELEQLIDVTATFGGETLRRPVIGRPEPMPGSWGSKFSLEGRSNAPDGRAATITLEVVSDDAELRLFARFDHVTARTPDGVTLFDTTPTG